jgi:hypothetical protein
MMSAELQHPGGGHRRRSDERKVVLVLAEGGASACARRATAASAGLATGIRSASAGARAPARGARAGIVPQHLVAAHDLGHLAVAVPAQSARQQRHDRGSLRRREITHPQARAVKHRARQVGPPRLLWTVERKLHLGSTGVIERAQQRLRGCHDLLRDVGLGAGRCRDCTTLGDRRRGDNDEQARQRRRCGSKW